MRVRLFNLLSCVTVDARVGKYCAWRTHSLNTKSQDITDEIQIVNVHTLAMVTVH